MFFNCKKVHWCWSCINVFKFISYSKKTQINKNCNLLKHQWFMVFLRTENKRSKNASGSNKRNQINHKVVSDM